MQYASTVQAFSLDVPFAIPCFNYVTVEELTLPLTVPSIFLVHLHKLAVVLIFRSRENPSSLIDKSCTTKLLWHIPISISSNCYSCCILVIPFRCYWYKPSQLYPSSDAPKSWETFNKLLSASLTSGDRLEFEGEAYTCLTLRLGPSEMLQSHIPIGKAVKRRQIGSTLVGKTSSSSSAWFSTFERSPVRNSLSSLAAWSMGGDGWWCPWWHVVLEKMMIRNWGEVTGAWHGGSLRCQFWRLPQFVCLDLVNGFSVQRRSSSSIVVSVWPRDGMCWRRVCS